VKGGGSSYHSAIEGEDEEVGSNACRNRMAIFLSGLGLLTDIYDLQVINLARPLIALSHTMSDSDEALITSAAIVGAIVGMLLFGALADKIGRRAMFLLTALLTSLGAIGSACAMASEDGSGLSIYVQLALWRFVMGVGIGGEYPLSAANSAEHGASKGGRQIALTYSMMGWGGLMAPTVFVILQSAQLPAPLVWRVGFAFGGCMSLAGTVLRLLFLEDSQKFVAAREQALKASAGQGGYLRNTLLSLGEYWRPLLGTALTWFLFDIYEYGLNLYTSEILRAAGWARAASPLDATLGVLALRLATIPGYLGSIWTIGRFGRRQTLDGGFVTIGLLFLVLGVFWEQIRTRPQLFMALFALVQVVDNAGCNAATYVIPAEIYPSALRATCHGASAAAGKLGAAVGSAAFPIFARAFGLHGVFLACASICVLGLAASRVLLPAYVDGTLTGLDQAHAEGTYLAHLYAEHDGLADGDVYESVRSSPSSKCWPLARQLPDDWLTPDSQTLRGAPGWSAGESSSLAATTARKRASRAPKESDEVNGWFEINVLPGGQAQAANNGAATLAINAGLESAGQAPAVGAAAK